MFKVPVRLKLPLPATRDGNNVIRLGGGGDLVELNRNNRRPRRPVLPNCLKNIRMVAPFKVRIKAFNGVLKLPRSTIHHIQGLVLPEPNAVQHINVDHRRSNDALLVLGRTRRASSRPHGVLGSVGRRQ